MDQQDFIYYLNFVVYAIVGRMADADDLYQRNPQAIHRAAAFMFRKLNLKLDGPFYRGVILGQANQTRLPPDPERTFISFSADLHVAKHFGDPDPHRGFGFGLIEMGGMFAPPFVDLKRGYYGDGYLIEYQPQPEEILYHHDLLNERGLESTFVYLFGQIGVDPGESQIKTFRGQKEILLVNRGQTFDLKPMVADAAYVKYATDYWKRRRSED